MEDMANAAIELTDADAGIWGWDGRLDLGQRRAAASSLAPGAAST